MAQHTNILFYPLLLSSECSGAVHADAYLQTFAQVLGEAVLLYSVNDVRVVEPVCLLLGSGGGSVAGTAKVTAGIFVLEMKADVLIQAIFAFIALFAAVGINVTETVVTLAGKDAEGAFAAFLLCVARARFALANNVGMTICAFLAACGISHTALFAASF